MIRAIPDLLLERYRLNELPEPAHAAIARDAAADPALRARLDALERSDAEIRDRYAPGVLAPRRPLDSPRSLGAGAPRRSTRALVLAGALATAIVALVIAIPRVTVPRVTVPTEDTRIKGAASLALYRRTPAGSERLADGDIARPGDLLRIGYSAGASTYGVILSIDGTGAVTLHLPPSGDHAALLAPGGMTLLDSAYELDEAPRIERFYLITGARPFDVAPVLAAARRAHGAPLALSLPSGLEQVTFAVQKEVRR
jgi:hypothetical protein